MVLATRRPAPHATEPSKVSRRFVARPPVPPAAPAPRRPNLPAMDIRRRPREDSLALAAAREAVDAPADPRSVRKLLLGEPVAPMTRERIVKALRKHGLEQLVPQAAAGDET
jgi:hypothetical protein